MHCGVLENLRWEDPVGLWGGGRTPLHCGMLEDQGWEDRNVLWDAGGLGVG